MYWILAQADWIAGGFGLVAVWMIGNKQKSGFLVNIVCDLVWIYVGIAHNLPGLMLIVIPMTVINARNWLKWSAETATRRKTCDPRD